LGAVEFWDVRVDRSLDRSGLRFFKMEERTHRKPRREVTTELIQKPANNRRSRCAHSMKIGKNGAAIQWEVNRKGCVGKGPF
jgi:hypothetical protein